MYEFASGAAAPVAVGLIGVTDPPLTPEPVAPAPSNFDPPPVPLRSFEAILAERTAAAPAAAQTTRRVVLTLPNETSPSITIAPRAELVICAVTFVTVAPVFTMPARATISNAPAEVSGSPP